MFTKWTSYIKELIKPSHRWKAALAVVSIIENSTFWETIGGWGTFA